MMQDTILDIPEEQWIKTFDTNIHGKPKIPLPFHIFQPPFLSSKNTDIFSLRSTSFLLPLQIYPPAHDQRRHHHQRRQRQRVHRASRPARLHLHQRRNHSFHLRAQQPMGRQRHPRQRRSSRPGLDASSRVDDDGGKPESFLGTYRQGRAAERDCDCGCVFGEYG
jgi:hypothetical protein